MGAVWRDSLGLGLPTGYEGANFVVSGTRILERSRSYYESLISLADTPPQVCVNSGVQAMNNVLSPMWHVVFGEPLQSPIRADNPELPLFLRAADGPSGFQLTRMPKSSAYLLSVEAEANASVDVSA